MDISNVMNRFAVLAGIDSSELPKWRSLVEDACAYVQSRCKAENPDSEQTARLEMLGAAYALRLFSLCGDQITQFIAGDVHVTSSADRRQRAEQLWRELAANSADLIHTDGFIFGRVIS